MKLPRRKLDSSAMQLLKALSLQVVANSCDLCWVVASQLEKAAKAEQHILKAVSSMLLQKSRKRWQKQGQVG